MLQVNARNVGDVSLLCPRGRIVKGEMATLRDAVDSQSHAGTVVLDLAQVSIVDAGGLGLMLELREEFLSKGITFKLMNAGRLVARVLEVTRLDSVFEFTSGAEFFSAVPRRRPAPMMQLRHCA